MRPSNASDPAQKWLKTTTDSGFAVYTNVKTGHCLTGRGLQGAPIVTAEKCFPGATKQQWNLGVSGDLKLRLNGFVAQVNPSTLTGVLMAFFTV